MSEKTREVVYAYDIESLPNFFCVTFIDVTTPDSLIDSYLKARRENDGDLMHDLIQRMDARIFEISDTVNDLPLLVDFLSTVRTLVAYNNKEYDDIILDYIYQESAVLSSYPCSLIAATIYNQSVDKINANLAWFTYRKINKINQHFYTIDLMKLNYLDKLFVSLKQVSIIIKWPDVEELQLPPITDEERDLYYSEYADDVIDKIEPFNRYIHGRRMARMVIDYNINDVLATIALHKFSLKELSTRITLGEKYPQFKGRLIDASRSTAATRILLTLYANAINDKYRDIKNARTYHSVVDFSEIVNPKVKFQSPYFQKFLRKLKSTTIPCSVDGASYTETLNFGGVGYTFGLGGLHSIDPPGKFHSSEDGILTDADVTSYYPRIIINDRVCPAHLSIQIFIEIYEALTNLRVQAKAEVKKSLSDALKIVINAVFGMFGDSDKFLYDLYATYKVTVNGQLYLLMLAERLSLAKFKVISANTDGILCKVPKSRKQEYEDICRKWEEDTGFNLEFTEYTKYVRTSVNDYLAATPDGKFKTKGDFVWELELTKGYSHPIVPIAIREFFINNIPVIETLQKNNNSKGIYDFCMAQKIGGQFYLLFDKIVGSDLVTTRMQKATRFFVSRSGGALYKKYRDKPKTISVASGKNVTIFNRAFEADSYDIDYSFYKKQCYTIIDKVLGNTESQVKKFGGNLFNDLGD